MHVSVFCLAVYMFVYMFPHVCLEYCCVCACYLSVCYVRHVCLVCIYVYFNTWRRGVTQPVRKGNSHLGSPFFLKFCRYTVEGQQNSDITEEGSMENMWVLSMSLTLVSEVIPGTQRKERLVMSIGPQRKLRASSHAEGWIHLIQHFLFLLLSN